MRSLYAASASGWSYTLCGVDISILLSVPISACRRSLRYKKSGKIPIWHNISILFLASRIISFFSGRAAINSCQMGAYSSFCPINHRQNCSSSAKSATVKFLYFSKSILKASCGLEVQTRFWYHAQGSHHLHRSPIGDASEPSRINYRRSGWKIAFFMSVMDRRTARCQGARLERLAVLAGRA